MIRVIRNKVQGGFVNPFQQKGIWFKANLHTHTTASDGEKTPEERIQEYRDHGYAILALTDHEVSQDVKAFSSKDFLVIGGMETHPRCPFENDVYHLVCLNVPAGLVFPPDADADTRIAIVKKLGGEVIFAHPYWSGFNINHLLSINDYIAIEVYNATSTKIGKACSSVQWDDLLTYGRFLPAVAVDDVHAGRDIFMGWTMIKARSLSVRSVLAALRNGCFYSSCGPIIEDFHIEKNEVVVRCSPAMEIHIMAQKFLGQSFYTDGEKELTTARCPLHDQMRYVRVEVVDRNGNRAWTNPIVLRDRL
jgi:hypothetical protein